MDSRETYIFFVDDEPSIRMAVKRTLERFGMHVSVFASAQDCLTELSVQMCDVLITDFRMDGMDGLSLLREVKRRFPWLPTIMITAYSSIPLAIAATKAGAGEFIEKPLDEDKLLSAIQRVLEYAARRGPPLKGKLSCIETQVLREILDGKTNKEIAHRFHRSIRTIEAHRRDIMRKLSTKNVAQLIRKASAWGFGNGVTIDGDLGSPTDLGL